MINELIVVFAILHMHYRNHRKSMEVSFQSDLDSHGDRQDKSSLVYRPLGDGPSSPVNSASDNDKYGLASYHLPFRPSNKFTTGTLRTTTTNEMGQTFKSMPVGASQRSYNHSEISDFKMKNSLTIEVWDGSAKPKDPKMFYSQEDCHLLPLN
jgi:hypothetical protein